MKKRTIYVSEKDMQRLKLLINSMMASTDNTKRDIRKLKEELNRAKVVSIKDMPPKVVTMNSIVCIVDLDTEKEMTWRLVYPKDEDIDKGRISILAPLGTAILGFFEGDTIEWDVPSGKRRIKVKSVVYQPEAAGDHTL